MVVVTGFIVGLIAMLFFWPLGLAIIALSILMQVAKAPPYTPPSKVCGQCAESIKVDAKICRYCATPVALVAA